MTLGESEEFTLNGTKCSIKLQKEFLEIRASTKDSKIPTNASNYLKIIPFFELISVKFINSNDVEKLKAGLHIANRSKFPQIEIKTVKRSKDHRWKLTLIKLKSLKNEVCEKWSKILLKKLHGFSVSRPKCLLVFVNPYGGTGSAKNVYDKKVAPIFDEAGVKTVVITTHHKHHAKEYVKENDLSSYDGIIAVGGDGMLNEVINGLLTKTQTERGGNIHATSQNPRDAPKYHRPALRVGVIPAGSTDCVSYVTQGINDAETSALHIVLGDSHPVDVVSLHNAEGLHRQFSLSLTGYGYFGDMLRHSESLRWMGPPRYTVVGANVFLRNKSYSGEVHYLPADVESDPRTSSFCRAPCSVCQDGFENEDASLFTPSTPGQSFKFSITGDEDENEISDDGSDLKRNRSVSDGFNELQESNSSPELITDFARVHETADDDKSFDEIFESEEDFTDSKEFYEPKLPVRMTTFEETIEELPHEAIPPKDRPKSLSIPSGQTRSEDSEQWKVIKGDFMSINGVAMSCACERSPLGLSPHSHLSDGAIDLIVVRSCTRLEFLRYMIAHMGKGDRFDFPYVEVHRVKAFQFIPSTPSADLLPAHYDDTIPSPSSVTTESSMGGTIHLSLPELRVQYKRSETKTKNKKDKKANRRMKRSQSETVTNSNPVSTWNSDGEIIREANMTVRVHRGLILMFSRGIENTGE